MEQSDIAERPKRMWLAVLAASALAAVGGGIFGALSGGASTDPARFREMGPEWAMGQEAQFAFLIPAVAVGVTWLIFFALVFRKHPLWKSLVALLIMALIGTLAAVPARLIAFTSDVAADDEVLAAWNEEARQRIRTLREPLFTEDGDVRLMRGLPVPRAVGDVDQYLIEVRDARARFDVYRSAINTELRESRESLIALDVFEGSKLERLAWYDQMLAPDSNAQRHLEATARALELQEQAYVYLGQHRYGWAIRDGRFGFVDSSVMDGFEAISGPLYEVESQIDHLNGAMGSAWGQGSMLTGRAADTASSPAEAP